MKIKGLLLSFCLLTVAAVGTNAQNLGSTSSTKMGQRLKFDMTNYVKAPADFKVQKFYKIASPMGVGALAPISPTVSDDNTMVYGYCIYDENFRSSGLIGFKTDDTERIKMLKNYGSANPRPTLVAGTMAKDKYCGLMIMQFDIGWTPIGFGEFHFDTGEFEVLNKYTDVKTIFSDMTYDSKNDIIYGVGWDNGVFRADNPKRALFKIDKSTNLPVQIGIMDKYLITLGADDEGHLYGIEYSGTDYQGTGKSGDLYILHPEESTSSTDIIKTTLVANTGIDASNVTQTMSFDANNRKMYWTGCPSTSATGFFAEVDLKTAKILSSKLLQGNMQFTGMAIPYQQNVSAGAPSFVRNMIVNPDDNMAAKAVLTWNNPSLTYKKETLTDLSSIKIYRNGELIKTLETTEVGKAMTWTDDAAPFGNDVYKLVAVNKAGEGLAREITAYVGEDIPGKVTNLKLSASGNTGTLIWNKPVAGKNGGKFKTEDLAYRITRMPDSVIVASSLTDTTFTDKVSKVAGYYYKVAAVNKTGFGEEVKSNVVSYGPSIDLPYEIELNTQDNFNSMNAVDANHDGNTWQFFNREAEYLYCPSAADDYLVTSFIKLKANTPYKLSYIIHGNGDIKNIVESMDIVYGSQPDKEHLQNVLKSYPSIIGQQKIHGNVTFTVPSDGDYVVGFHCNSEANQWFVGANYLKIEVHQDKDFEAYTISGPAKATVGLNSDYTVKVVNAGLKDQSNVKVQIIDENKKVLSEVNYAKTIKAGDTVSVTVPFTPKEEGKISVFGKVVLEGDADSNNDVTFDSLRVRVASAGEGQWVEIRGAETYTTGIGPWLFSLDWKTSAMQSIYLQSELNTTKKYIKGVEYYYAPYDPGFDPEDVPESPVQIYMMNTDKSEFVDDGGFIGSKNDFTLVYDGLVKTDQQQTPITCIFDKAFEYTGKNICVMTIRPMDITSYNHFGLWKCFAGKGRSYSFRSTKAEFDLDTFTAPTQSGNWYRISSDVPVTSFALSDTGSGIHNLNNASDVKATFVNGIIWLSSVCDNVAVYDLSGRLVGNYTQTNIVSAQNMNKGYYIMKVSGKQGNKSLKVLVK